MQGRYGEEAVHQVAVLDGFAGHDHLPDLSHFGTRVERDAGGEGVGVHQDKIVE